MPTGFSEIDRIKALFSGDPRANLASWRPEGYVEEPTDLTNAPTAYNSDRIDNASKSFLGDPIMRTALGNPSVTYQDVLRRRMGAISGLSDIPTQSALAAAQQRQAAAAMMAANSGGGGTYTGNATGSRAKLLKLVAAQKGMPYSWGGGNSKGPSYGLSGAGERHGSSKIYGFDCSGLVQYAFAQIGIKLPRGGNAQLATGIKTPISKLQPGDLVGKPGHVAVYAGNGMMWEAPTFGKSVRLVPVRAGMFGVHINY